MILGRSLAALKTAARAKAIEHYAELQEQQRPGALARTDALKLAEAKRVLAGESSTYIEAEAELKGLDALAMAKAIQKASDDQALVLELGRQAVNVAIDRAKTHAEIRQVLDAAGIDWPK
ncbi:hypothetical protein [Methylobacterium sp. AMS5]|uniref:hypothetical protein n=1 Tax=Methylobacterium sp. AMS5 TaxID=925818 RepID=UPI00074F9F5D|nr:hypothetical protein [Methylobacterium sp. AMS5]AMB48253.1 hypothetical protein Y590_25125 [Methylobacterium sp. AMS5]